MFIERTVEIPADHRLTIEVPREIPEGKTRVIIQFPAPACGSAEAGIDFAPSYPPEEAIKAAAQRLANPNRRLPSSYRGILSPDTYGDGLAYQQKLRDEWHD
jgi:hypothetical protein